MAFAVGKLSRHPEQGQCRADWRCSLAADGREADPRFWMSSLEESVSSRSCKPTASGRYNPQKCWAWHTECLTKVRITCQYIKHERLLILKTPDFLYSRKKGKSGHTEPTFPLCHTQLEAPPLAASVCFP